MAKRKSLIWQLSRQEFNDIIQLSKTYKEALIKMGFAVKSGGNYKTLKQRIKEDNIDASHIIEAKKTFRGVQKKKSLEEIMVKNSDYNACHLKKRLFNENILEKKCSKCGLGTEWQGELIVLQLDHINGDHNDNRLENLRVLCPNCHSQTDTYSGRNAKVKNYCNCGKEINNKSSTCLKCIVKKTKIKWPSNEELKAKLKNQSFLSLGKELGVSDNAIRKRLKNH